MNIFDDAFLVESNEEMMSEITWRYSMDSASQQKQHVHLPSKIAQICCPIHENRQKKLVLKFICKLIFNIYCT